MSTHALVHVFAVTRDALARAALRMHLSPNVLTVAGLLVSLAAGVLLGAGWWGWAAGAMFLTGLADLLDGAVARLGRSATTFGAFLDSTLDRVSDVALYGGLATYYAAAGNRTYVVLCLSGLGAAIVISYSRARAENLIEQCRGGFWQRGERFVALWAGAVSGHPSTAVWVLAVCPWSAAIQRVWHTWRMTHPPYRELRARCRPLGDLLVWHHRRGSVAHVAMSTACLAVILFVHVPETDWISLWFG